MLKKSIAFLKINAAHLTVFLVIFIISWAGIGYRFLSQDETETAVRGKTVTESGFPRVIEKNGQVSVFVGGRELEEGALHRYTPWLQFYVAGAGVKLGQILHMPQDRAVRTPFAFSHALTSGLISFGLTHYAGMVSPAAPVLALLYGIQTDRLLHNRTARYHALMDLLVMIGLLGCAGARLKRGWGLAALGSAIFLLPQTHTMTGSLISLLLGVLGGSIFIEMDVPLAEKIKKFVGSCLLPGLISLILMLILVRPWAQTVWAKFDPYSAGHSYNIHRKFVYAYGFMVLLGGFLLLKRRWSLGAGLLACFALILILCPVIDQSQMSQFRYYLPLWLFAMMSPIIFDWSSESLWVHWPVTVVMFLLIIIPEFTTRYYHPYQGIQIAIDDIRKEWKGQKQPLHEVVDIIRSQGQENPAILFDAVPLYANWYFPNATVALMPDASGRHKLNVTNPIWNKPLVMPDWHIWYPTRKCGVASIIDADYFASHVDLEKGRYQLTSRKLHQTADMCIERSWKTDLFNNYPFMLYREAGFTPAGGDKDILVLARKCGS